MLSFFERIIKPFPAIEPGQPPKGLFAFCRHYTKGMEKSLILMSLTTAFLAMLEVSLFSFMGQLVDWLVQNDPQSLFSTERTTLIKMAVVTLILLPGLSFVHAAIVHQTLLGNYPMSIRWLAHRYLLRQSISFYQNDFAGRIATKVMQTALAVRETVMKLLDVMVYILVYFGSMLFFIADADIRLIIPMLVWLCIYISMQFYFVPRLKQASTRQADARSEMTGRIVDSYTNITTIKLFSHTNREEAYAKDSMEVFLKPVYRQMRLATGLSVSVQTLNYFLVFAVAAMSIWLWADSAISVGAIAIAVSLALRLNGMAQWIMWEISSLFENIGTVADGITTCVVTPHIHPGRYDNHLERLQVYCRSFRLALSQQAIDLGLADKLGNIDYVAREVVKAEEIVDYTRKENVAERLVKRFGASIGDGAVKALRPMAVERASAACTCPTTRLTKGCRSRGCRFIS